MIKSYTFSLAEDQYWSGGSESILKEIQFHFFQGQKITLWKGNKKALRLNGSEL